jgi:hypothetical protein
MRRGDGLFKRRYKDKSGKERTSPFWWYYDPLGREKSTKKRDKEAALLVVRMRERVAADPAYAAAQTATVEEWARKLLAAVDDHLTIRDRRRNPGLAGASSASGWSSRW